MLPPITNEIVGQAQTRLRALVTATVTEARHVAGLLSAKRNGEKQMGTTLPPPPWCNAPEIPRDLEALYMEIDEAVKEHQPNIKLPTADAQRALEIERGRFRTMTNERAATMRAYYAAQKVLTLDALDQPDTVVFYVGDVEVCRQKRTDIDYPSEVTLATVSLAIAATTGFTGVKPEGNHEIDPAERKRRDEYIADMAARRNRPHPND